LIKEPLRCMKCETQMEEGFVLDNAHAARLQSEWVQGAPEEGWFGNVKLKGRLQLSIATFRCPKCGYLESYAPPA
jgi:predicted Zn-ribbon and HTH transcriptional regulator